MALCVKMCCFIFCTSPKSFDKDLFSSCIVICWSTASTIRIHPFTGPYHGENLPLCEPSPCHFSVLTPNCSDWSLGQLSYFAVFLFEILWVDLPLVPCKNFLQEFFVKIGFITHCTNETRTLLLFIFIVISTKPPPLQRF